MLWSTENHFIQHSLVYKVVVVVDPKHTFLLFPLGPERAGAVDAMLPLTVLRYAEISGPPAALVPRDFDLEFLLTFPQFMFL